MGREQLLDAIVVEASACNWPGDFHGGWVEWDLELVGDAWHKIHIRTATEELGWPRRFTRARCTASLTGTAWLAALFGLSWTAAGLFTGSLWGSLVGLFAVGLLLVTLGISRTRCLNAATSLLLRASLRAGFATAREENSPEADLDSEQDEIFPVPTAELAMEPAGLPLPGPSQKTR